MPIATDRRAFVALVVAIAGLVSCDGSAHGERKAEATIAPAWLTERAHQESELAAKSSVLHDFRFIDNREASGISFVNHVVDDAGKSYKLVHYDHGSGICAADVDSDSLPDLYFATQLGTNELYRNAGGGRYTNITTAAGLNIPDAIAVGCSFADVDNDGDPDLFVTTVRHGNHLFENQGNGRFRDITGSAGVGYTGHSSGAVFFDYDGDGLLDLFVTNVGVYTSNEQGAGTYYVGLTDAFMGHLHPDRAESSILYHNLGGNRFRDVTRETGLVDKSWSGDATALDINNDRFPDLYILDMQGGDHLWLNDGGKHFRDATAKYFPKSPWGSMGVKVFDFDGDNRLDIFVTSMHPDMWVNIPPGDWAAEARKADSATVAPGMIPEGKSRFIFGNELFADRPSGFSEVSDSLGVETYWPWGPTVDDFNADGWDDIFIAAGMNFPYRYGINSLLLNESGRHFLPSEFVVGVEPRAKGATQQVWFTLECNGKDAFNPLCGACTRPEASSVGCHLDSSKHLTMMAALGTRAAVALDLDNDGDTDIVTNEFNGPPQVLVSDLSQRHRVNYLKVRLRGTRSNRDGLGARVIVVLPDGRRILKVMDGKSGYLSQSDLPLYFGLGNAETARSIEVNWPSGRTQTVGGPIKAGGLIDVVEPDSIAAK